MLKIPDRYNFVIVLLFFLFSSQKDHNKIVQKIMIL